MKKFSWGIFWQAPKIFWACSRQISKNRLGGCLNDLTELFYSVLIYFL